jgi:hypothetical protein
LEGSKSGGAASTGPLNPAYPEAENPNDVKSVNAPQYPPDVINPNGVKSVNAPLYPPSSVRPKDGAGSRHDPYGSDNSPDHSDHSDHSDDERDAKKKHIYPRGGGGGKKGGGDGGDSGVSGSGRVGIPVMALVGGVLVAAVGVGMMA